MGSSYPALLSVRAVPETMEVPKGIVPGDPLVWTRQIDDLAREIDNRKGKLGVAGNCFILSGPSGVGKSCLALSIALQLQAKKERVLYVPDCGNLVLQAKELAGMSRTNAAISAGMAVLRRLVRDFDRLNIETIGNDLTKADNFTFEGFVSELNRQEAVVIMDEQGAAFSTLIDRDELEHFPFLRPNYWITAGLRVRILMTGSSQVPFEDSLNGTYIRCLRFARPFDAPEANVLNHVKNWGLDMGSAMIYCNFVPREMWFLSRAPSADAYIKRRASEMTSTLMLRYQKSATIPMAKDDVNLTLRLLLRDGSLQESQYLQVSGLGLVYRLITTDDLLLALPLCLAAERALLALWAHTSPESPIALARCIEESRDDDFELLVYETLIKKLSVPGGNCLKCQHLGIKFEETFAIQVNSVYNAICALEEVADDIVRIRSAAASEGITILYRCPKNAETIDFCILSATWVFAIQASLLSLTKHRKPDAGFLHSIGASSCGYQTRQMNWRYLYITTKPERHAGVAVRGHFWGIDVSNIRVVDANSWIRR